MAGDFQFHREADPEFNFKPCYKGGRRKRTLETQRERVHGDDILGCESIFRGNTCVWRSCLRGSRHDACERSKAGQRTTRGPAS